MFRKVKFAVQEFVTLQDVIKSKIPSLQNVVLYLIMSAEPSRKLKRIVGKKIDRIVGIYHLIRVY